MLILKRATGESVVLTVAGHTIRVTLIDIRGKKYARLGFEASSEVIIAREEVMYRDVEDVEEGNDVER